MFGFGLQIKQLKRAVAIISSHAGGRGTTFRDNERQMCFTDEEPDAKKGKQCEGNVKHRLLEIRNDVSFPTAVHIVARHASGNDRLS
jgi:hypothetical protein